MRDEENKRKLTNEDTTSKSGNSESNNNDLSEKTKLQNNENKRKITNEDTTSKSGNSEAHNNDLSENTKLQNNETTVTPGKESSNPSNTTVKKTRIKFSNPYKKTSPSSGKKMKEVKKSAKVGAEYAKLLALNPVIAPDAKTKKRKRIEALNERKK